MRSANRLPPALSFLPFGSSGIVGRLKKQKPGPEEVLRSFGSPAFSLT